MGQSWSSRAADCPTCERRRRKHASESEQIEEIARFDPEHNKLSSTNSPVRRRDGQSVSNSAIPKTHHGNRRQNPSCTSHHAILSSTRTTKEEPSIPDRSQSHKDAKKEPKPGRIKSKNAEQSNAKHRSVRQKHSRHQREGHHAENKEKKECVVCTGTISLHRFPDRPPTRDCKHGVDVCRKCLHTWIESEFRAKMWDDIKCPICSTSLEIADMQAFAPKDVLKCYTELSTRAKQEARPGFTWCNRKGCKAGQVHPPHTPKFRCNTCEKPSCVVHNTKWHKGETCSEYDYRTNAKLKAEEEEASRRMVEATTKQCPGCKRPIEKNMGCNHMECMKCRVHFCWKCLLPYHSDSSRRARAAGGAKYCECHLFYT